MTLTTLLWITASVAAVLFILSRSRGDVTGPQARALVSAGAALIDVRSPGEFAAGHVDQARNIPVGELAGRLGELGAKEQPVVLYCASGIRSAAAARTLRSNGFQQVHNLGAMRRW